MRRHAETSIHSGAADAPAPASGGWYSTLIWVWLAAGTIARRRRSPK